ncbi:hypothetical protein FEZ51_02155 [Pediococcus stilesii]|uniref:Uncharacterized protein n=1 Tax=Pediococcus stilesii TaxID=331679 RepID=A0A5R9BZK8_9LACO|nr:hypothetical protein [Pediococcus stilesii]TLQ05482.1 hypothetical protein FEZ51_02155 [Pediococcus stilesii]
MNRLDNTKSGYSIALSDGTTESAKVDIPPFMTTLPKSFVLDDAGTEFDLATGAKVKTKLILPDIWIKMMISQLVVNDGIEYYKNSDYQIALDWILFTKSLAYNGHITDAMSIEKAINDPSHFDINESMTSDKAATEFEIAIAATGAGGIGDLLMSKGMIKPKETATVAELEWYADLRKVAHDGITDHDELYKLVEGK